MELFLTCVAIIGALQSIVGIIAQALPLAGIRDYSSPIGPWVILWMAVANAFGAASMLFDLVTVTFFEGHESCPELILVTIMAILEIGISIFMLYVLRYAPAAVVYLSTTIVLYIGILWISAQSYLSHKSRNNTSVPRTTTSLLSESPVEASDNTNPSVRNENTHSDAARELSVEASHENNSLLPREQPEAKDDMDSIAQIKASSSLKMPAAARIAAVFIPLFISLCIHAFLCSQTYFLVTLSPKSPTARSIALYSYIDDEAQTGRYTSLTNVDIIRPLEDDMSKCNCITIMLHDQGQDSTTLLPLAHNASAADPHGCIYALLDRPGYGSSTVGKYPLELVTEARLVNDIALLLAAEVAFDFRESCQLAALYKSNSEQYELIDARYIESCFAKQNISADMISQKIKFTCVGHGSGTSVCLTWAKLAARMPDTLVASVDKVVGLDYFPQQLVLEVLYGADASTAILRHEEERLRPIKSVIAPFGIGSYVYDTGRYDEAGDYVLHLADIAPDVERADGERFRRRTSLCTFSEGYSASLSEATAYSSQTIKLDEFTSQNITPPNTVLFLLTLSAHSCTRGPSAVECSLFGSDEERAEVLARVTEDLQTELLDTITEEYSGAPDDLWSAPQGIVEWLVMPSSRSILIK